MSELWNAWYLLNTHSSGLELFQATTALAGVSISVWALTDAVKDAMALRMSGVNGPRSIIASGNIFTEVERLFIHGILFLVGFASVFLAPPYAQGEAIAGEELLQHVLLRLGLIAITVLKVAAAIRARRERALFVRRMSLGGYNETLPSVALAPPPGVLSEHDPRLLRKDAGKNKNPLPRRDEDYGSAGNSSVD